MITYELAKKLRESGFPPLTKFEPRTVFNEDSFNSEYPPSLSELIEACGSRINNLERSLKGWIARGDRESGDMIPDGFLTGEGPTPEEAVALLWLELNKK